MLIEAMSAFFCPNTAIHKKPRSMFDGKVIPIRNMVPKFLSSLPIVKILIRWD